MPGWADNVHVAGAGLDDEAGPDRRIDRADRGKKAAHEAIVAVAAPGRFIAAQDKREGEGRLWTRSDADVGRVGPPLDCAADSSVTTASAPTYSTAQSRKAAPKRIQIEVKRQPNARIGRHPILHGVVCARLEAAQAGQELIEGFVASLVKLAHIVVDPVPKRDSRCRHARRPARRCGPWAGWRSGRSGSVPCSPA